MYNSIYPVNIKPYVPPQNKKQVGASGEETSQNAALHRENRDIYQSSKENKDTYKRQEYPNGQKSQIDYSKNKVNIAQIITDFRATEKAIGTPDEVLEKVESYLSLAEKESLEGSPNKKIIQTNLKNASTILDDFISKTLNKESNVVNNWIDALFLQQVDYKSDPNSINPDFLVKLPGKDNSKALAIAEKNKAEQTKAETSQTTPAQTETAPAALENSAAATSPIKESKVYIPQDPELKKSFIQGKKYAAINDSEKALAAFGVALSQANDLNDRQAASMVCYEIGQIYDKADNLEEALKYYNQTLENTADNNLKARAYYSMAQIYNDAVYFEPAMNHYYAAISCAGETENFNAQSKALTDIAQMYAERYDKNNAITYMSVAKNIAAETKDNKTLGAIYSKSGDTLKMLEENVSALNDYKESARFYEQAQSPAKVAKNYEKAAFIMIKLGNTSKADSLFAKAEKIAALAEC